MDLTSRRTIFNMGEPEPLYWLGNRREVYDIYFNYMVSQLAEDFTQKETQKLCFIFQQQLPGSFLDQHSQNALKILEYLMRKKNLFSSDNPQKLAMLMELLELPEKKERVNTFMDKYKDLDVNPMQQRSLPPTPPTTHPIQEETEVGYVTLHPRPSTPLPSTPSLSPMSSLTTRLPLQCDSSSVHSEEPQQFPPRDPSQGDYVVLRSSSSHSHHTGSENRASISKFSDQSSSTDDDDPLYAEPYTDILLPLKSQQEYTLRELMKLLVSPLRDIVTDNKEQVLISHPFQCHLPRCTFHLEINPLDGQCLSAKLFLKPGAQDSDSLSSNFYLVELSVAQRKKKPQRSPQAIYLHSTLMRNPTTDSHTDEDSHPDIQTKTSQSSEPSTEAKDKGMCVASFPSIMTHEMLMDQKLISRQYLVLSFTLKLYQNN